MAGGDDLIEGGLADGIAAGGGTDGGGVGGGQAGAGGCEERGDGETHFADLIAIKGDNFFFCEE